jgi:hypothetical protein
MIICSPAIDHDRLADDDTLAQRPPPSAGAAVALKTLWSHPARAVLAVPEFPPGSGQNRPTTSPTAGKTGGDKTGVLLPQPLVLTSVTTVRRFRQLRHAPNPISSNVDKSTFK